MWSFLSMTKIKTVKRRNKIQNLKVNKKYNLIALS